MASKITTTKNKNNKIDAPTSLINEKDNDDDELLTIQSALRFRSRAATEENEAEDEQLELEAAAAATHDAAAAAADEASVPTVSSSYGSSASSKSKPPPGTTCPGAFSGAPGVAYSSEAMSPARLTRAAARSEARGVTDVMLQPMTAPTRLTAETLITTSTTQENNTPGVEGITPRMSAAMSAVESMEAGMPPPPDPSGRTLKLPNANGNVLLSASGQVSASSSPPPPTQEEEEQQPKTKTKGNPNNRQRLWMVGGAIVLVVLILAIVIPVVLVTGGSSDGTTVIAPYTNDTNNQTTEAGPLVELYPNLLPRNIISNATAAALLDPTSPQYQAFEWLSQDPQIDTYPEWQKVQRFALATLYHAMNGPAWENTTTGSEWLSYDSSECDWINRNNESDDNTHNDSDDKNPCHDNGRVKLLNMTKQRGFQGRIPPELSLLTELQSLDFSNNILLQSLSDLFSQASVFPSSLQHLYCSSCRLEGTLPPTMVRQMMKLERLALADNAIEGSLPSEVGLWTLLTYWDMSFNQLTGSVPTQIGRLSNLQELQLRQNQLTSFPSAELGQLTKLKQLALGRNSLQMTPLPTELGLLTDLRGLGLDRNNIAGSLPSELGLLTNLAGLFLQGNQLTGTIAESIVSSMINVTDFWLFNNKLVGSIPAVLGLSMTRLTNLDLASNGFTSTIPSEIGLLSNLEKLTLEENQLVGRLPSEIGNLVHLTTLNVRDNDLAEIMPPEICHLLNRTNHSKDMFVTSWCGGEAKSCCERQV